MKHMKHARLAGVLMVAFAAMVFAAGTALAASGSGKEGDAGGGGGGDAAPRADRVTLNLISGGASAEVELKLDTENDGDDVDTILEGKAKVEGLPTRSSGSNDRFALCANGLFVDDGRADEDGEADMSGDVDVSIASLSGVHVAIVNIGKDKPDRPDRDAACAGIPVMRGMVP